MKYTVLRKVDFLNKKRYLVETDFCGYVAGEKQLDFWGINKWTKQ